MGDVEYSLRRQTEAARDLVLAIHSQGEGDDADLIADTIEGETGLLDAIGAAIDELDECELVEAGCDKKLDDYGKRKSAAKSRAERIRAAIERAMMATDQDKLKLPTATLSLAKRKPQPVIDDEASIPSRFFVAQPTPAPKLDKKALAEALAGGAVTGAHLDNGSSSLTIRRK